MSVSLGITVVRVHIFFQIFNFFKSAILGVILVAEHEFGIYFLKFSTLGPLGLKFSKIVFAKKTFYGVFGGPDHEYDISFLKFSILGPLGSKNLRKNPLCYRASGLFFAKF